MFLFFFTRAHYKPKKVLIQSPPPFLFFSTLKEMQSIEKNSYRRVLESAYHSHRFL
jgi:hypothetical protein